MGHTGPIIGKHPEGHDALGIHKELIMALEMLTVFVHTTISVLFRAGSILITSVTQWKFYE